MDNEQTGHRKGNSTEPLVEIQSILKALNILPGQTVLDVGCGNGYMAKEFSRLVTETGKVHGLDRSPQAIETLEKETQDTNICPIEADITQRTALQAASVDLIYLSTVFHVFSEEQKDGFVREANRLLKPKGKLALVEIEKKDTPFGPPRSKRVSPAEMQQSISMKWLSLTRVGEHFYMQVFEKNE
ncbi:MAG: class I SAM-dependent methyltransferase [Sedimentisphaerales bacterium]|nr:class I SAM-dependent methyltransferase [Sedimentisphaerales bacterium]